jgi:hypothetical protein
MKSLLRTFGYVLVMSLAIFIVARGVMWFKLQTQSEFRASMQDYIEPRPFAEPPQPPIQHVHVQHWSGKNFLMSLEYSGSWEEDPSGSTNRRIGSWSLTTHGSWSRTRYGGTCDWWRPSSSNLEWIRERWNIEDQQYAVVIALAGIPLGILVCWRRLIKRALFSTGSKMAEASNADDDKLDE